LRIPTPGSEPALRFISTGTPESDTVEIYLPVVSRVSSDVVSTLIKVITHEVMHHVFKVVLGKQTIERVSIEHRLMKKLGIE